MPNPGGGQPIHFQGKIVNITISKTVVSQFVGNPSKKTETNLQLHAGSFLDLKLHIINFVRVHSRIQYEST